MIVKKRSELFSELLGGDDMPNDRIVPYIERWLVEHGNAGLYEVDDRPYRSKVTDVRKKHFHPSGDCLKCPRLLYFERTPGIAEEIEESFEPRTLAIFKMGDAVHAMLQAWFSAMDGVPGYPDLVGNEYRFDDPQNNIGGFMDSVIRFPGSDQPTVLELKSINSRQFGSLVGPKPAHRMQVGCYVMELGCPFGIVLYVNKDTCEMKEYRVDPVDMMPVLVKWARVRQAIADGSPDGLDHGCRFGSREHKWCPARDHCFRGADSVDVDLSGTPFGQL